MARTVIIAGNSKYTTEEKDALGPRGSPWRTCDKAEVLWGKCSWFIWIRKEYVLGRIGGRKRIIAFSVILEVQPRYLKSRTLKK